MKTLIEELERWSIDEGGDIQRLCSRYSFIDNSTV